MALDGAEVRFALQIASTVNNRNLFCLLWFLKKKGICFVLFFFSFVIIYSHYSLL